MTFTPLRPDVQFSSQGGTLLLFRKVLPMFQFSCRPVMRTVLLLLSLLSLCGACQAGGFVINDTRYSSEEGTEWRLKVWVEGSMVPTIITPAANYNVYTFQGNYEESTYLMYWTCTQAHSIPGATIVIVDVEMHFPGIKDENGDDLWYTSGAATCTIQN